jgi:hypothetical protein
MASSGLAALALTHGIGSSAVNSRLGRGRMGSVS